MDQIGRYEILGEVGRGGFGVVYRAHDPVMRRNVAVKVLTMVSDPALLARFRSEAGATGNLRHKNIITVHDYGEHEGRPYLVMELLEGRTLQEVIRSGPPLSLFEKVSVLLQVAEGLRFAHEQGVVHRDVKPSNVMLLNDGGAKILDFGIARFLDTARTRHTTPGFILGTIEYMSPDQLQGVDADPLTDIFSFGVTAYELLSGRQPFRAEDASRVLYLLASADPASLCQVVPGCPEALQNIVGAALAKDRSQRYQSMQELLFDLAPMEASLRRERAAELAADAGRLIETGDLDNAQSSLNRALELDPACEKGRELRRDVQKRRERRELLRRAEALVETGEERMAARRFEAAVEAFESALRTIPADAGPMRPDVERRLFAASQSRETAKHTEALLAEAQEAAGRGDLTEAHRLASEAAALDPSDTRAAGLAQQLAAEIEQRQAEQERQRQERVQREETVFGLAQAVREHVAARRYSEALRLVEGALGQYPGDEILQNVGTAVQEARRRHAEELEAERRQYLEMLRQAEEELLSLRAESGKEMPAEGTTPAPAPPESGKAASLPEAGYAPPEPPFAPPPATPDGSKVGRTPPSGVSSGAGSLAAAPRSPSAQMRGRKPAQPARKALSVRLASLGSRLGARTAVLAAAGLVALVLVFWLWPSSQRIEKGQKAELPDLRDGIPKAIATHQWPQAEASIAKLEQLAPTDLRAAEWSKQVVTGRALDALRSSIQSSIRAQDWATAEVQIADLKAKAPDDPQAPEWQATVDQGRQAGIPTQTEQKAETEPIWPVEGGDARCSGYASSRGPRNPKESWDVQAPSTESHSPLIGPEGRVYISVTEGAGAGQARQLWCVAANSSILWKTPIGPSDRVGFAPDGSVQLKSARRTRTLNRDGGVSADASSDNSWIGFRLLGGHRYSSGGSAPNGYCQRLDDPQWRTDLDGDTSGGWAMDDRGSIYVGTHRGTLYALSDTGRVIWRKNISGVDSFNGLAVTADRDVLAATGPAGSAGDARVRDAAALLCVRDGQVRWKYATDDAHVTAPIHDVTGTIFFGSGTKLYALSSAGQELWGLDLHDTLTSQAAMDKNGRIYVSTMKGLYCISETPRN